MPSYLRIFLSYVAQNTKGEMAFEDWQRKKRIEEADRTIQTIPGESKVSNLQSKKKKVRFEKMEKEKTSTILEWSEKKN